MGDNRNGPARANCKDLVPSDVDHAHLAHDDASVGDIDRSVGADGDVVQQHGTLRLEIDLAERLTAKSVEGADNVDVGCPQRVTMDREPLRGIECHAVLTSDGEQFSSAQAVTSELDDVAVVVVPRARSVHDRDEVHILTGRVADRFRTVEALNYADAMRCCRDRVSWIVPRLLSYESSALRRARGELQAS